jgi:hypothetical protein
MRASAWIRDLNPGPTIHKHEQPLDGDNRSASSQAGPWVTPCYGRLRFSSQLCTTDDLNYVHVA